MADGGGRCLSDLPDDLLRHILFFAPAREGATTAVLSRRWRWLWRTSGAVNLDSRSFKHPCSSHTPFLRGAEKALAAAQDPIRRLTFFIAEGSEINLTRRRREDGWVSASDHNLIEALLSNPAAWCVEELRIEVEDEDTSWTLSLGSLRSEALQVLRIVNSSPLMAAPPPAAAAATFPRLADLYLHGCNVSVEDLNDTIAAAPQLSTLHLESCCFYSVRVKSPRDEREQVRQFDIDIGSVCYPILCPAVTALVLADCRVRCVYHRYGKARLEISLDVPKLQYFRYEGSVVQLTDRLRLKRHASNDMIRQVDLRLTHGTDLPYYHCGRRICELFWRFVQSFNATRRLKLKLDFLMDDLVLADKAIKDVLLGSFSFYRVEQLELEGKYEPRTTSMVLLADLLCCCPVVRDLRLKFSKVELPLAPMRSSLDKEEAAADDSVVEIPEHLNPNVRRWKVGENAKDIKLQHVDNSQDYGIPGLTGEHAFSCLQSQLKRVSLDFHMDAPTYLGVKLAKFFAEKAMVLQEIQVNESDQAMLEHFDPSIRRLMVASIRRSLTKWGSMPSI